MKVLLCILLFLGFQLSSAENYGPFVEKNFPFVQSALIADSQAPFPNTNTSSRAVLIQLGEKTWASFDTELMRISAIWKGSFDLNSMSQISYPNKGAKSSTFPKIKGDLLFASPMQRGPSLSLDHQDKRKVPLGLHKNLNWQGLQTSHNKVILNYQLQDLKIKEFLSLDSMGIFSRNFQLSHKQNISLLLFQKSSYKNLRKVGSTYQVDDGNEQLKLFATSGDFTLDKGGRLFLRNPQKTNFEVRFSYETAKLDKVLSSDSPSFQVSKKLRWPQKIQTKAKISASNQAYVVDEIELPKNNPWQRSLRLASLDFFSDGRAAAVTFDGDVWLIDGLKGDMKTITWKRFASGLYSPLSLKIHKNKIYILGRDQITRLHDTDNNGEADYYENFCNLFDHSLNTRNFAMDMVFDENGDIYIARGGILDKKDKYAQKPFKIPTDTGSILKISKEGKYIETFADGFREPFLAYNPLTQQLFANDQQGHFVPSSPLIKIQAADFAGFQPANHRKVVKTHQPFVWLPHRVEPSCVGMNFVNSQNLGPINHRMISHSYSKGRSLLMYEGKGFGAAVILPYSTHFPLLKGTIHPLDGSLFLTGFKIYSNRLAPNSGLARIRYTKKPVNFPLRVQVYKEGLELTFDEALDENSDLNLKSYTFKRWKYKRSSRYGSGHFKLTGEAGEESLLASQAILSQDKKSLMLIIPGMTACDQFTVNYSFKKGQNYIKDTIYLTLDHFQPIPTQHYAFTEVKKHDLKQVKFANTAKRKASATHGKELLLKNACIACHSLDGSQEGKLGPSFKGMFGSTRNFEKAKSLKANEDFIKESLIFPNKKVAKGYAVAMASYAGILSDSDMESIILYLKTLK
ncbi:putative large multi-functional protein [Lentisphaera araneosa HTCC2155]|uniref:Putative large multi-functional protein n=1 Tax=Lentisphaera araneosa HTCC2155 TaxID=313628 RepID=A6DS70_9BACT|nr:putative large multi-functional protein [Lentisphaera araneosa HTCC2155]